MAKANNRGLGRGFDALIPTDIVEKEFDPSVTKPTAGGSIDEVLQLPPDSIKPNPHQPREVFDAEALSGLSDSIKQHGILQPLVVTRDGEGYQLIAGERRLRAAKEAGLSAVPAIVRSYDEQQKLELALIENIQRQDLNPMETATAYKKLQTEFNMTNEEIGRRVGKDRTTVSNSMRLLGLPIEAKRALAAGEIGEALARTILSVTDPVKQLELLELIIKNNWTVRQAEEFARGFKHREGSHEKGMQRLADQNDVTKGLEKYLGAKVRLAYTAKATKLIIEAKNDEELERISKLLIRD